MSKRLYRRLLKRLLFVASVNGHSKHRVLRYCILTRKQQGLKYLLYSIAVTLAKRPIVTLTGFHRKGSVE